MLFNDINMLYKYVIKQETIEDVQKSSLTFVSMCNSIINSIIKCSIVEQVIIWNASWRVLSLGIIESITMYYDNNKYNNKCK